MSNKTRSGVQQGHVARKRFGQNFLVDDGIIDAIVAGIAPRRDDLMVEIGPGLGALTGPLLARLDTLHVIELDRDLVARLEKRFNERLGGPLVVHAGDVLKFDFATLLEGGDAAARKLRIVGNLPYNISSPLLFHLMPFADRVRDQHFMLQDEVVARMVATPGGKDYGRLSVMLQYRYWMEKMLDVPPASFNPPPKVNSAVVRMMPWPAAELPDVDAATLARVVADAFSQRRKMLRNTLEAYRERVDFDALGFDLTRRAEDVPVAEYITLAQAVHSGASDHLGTSDN